MELIAKRISNALNQSTGCAVMPVFKGKKLSAAAKAFDSKTNGLIRAAVRRGDISGNFGESLMIQSPTNMKAQRILLIGCGAPKSLGNQQLRKLYQTILKSLKSVNNKDATIFMEELFEALGSNANDNYSALANIATTASYQYTETKSKTKKLSLKKITLNVGSGTTLKAASDAVKQGQAIGQGINTARQLGNLPGNICTPNYLASQARKLATKHSRLTTKVLDEKQMKKLGMNSLLSVTAGTVQPARLIVMEYSGAAKKQQPYVLVGKGITFDSGGISLKPGGRMDEMKFDMCGAASVFGTMDTITALNLNINVVAIVAAAENMPGSQATKPGDIVTSMSGQTIEILNTDAEGRLVLCDALTYAERFNPKAVIDIATLTGACVVALGKHASALYSNNEKLAEQLLTAGEHSTDRAWRMPLWDDYQSQLNSNFADMSNLGGPEGGSITAACFLSRFTKKYNWSHLDIAGSAWLNGGAKGATGRPVGLLSQFLIDRA